MEPQYSLYVIFAGLVISLALLPNPTTALSKCSFPAIFNFGDSNSDTGGLSAAFGQAPPPNGETFFHTPSGRYSDGRLVIDFIGTFISLSFCGSTCTYPLCRKYISVSRSLYV